MKHYISLGAGLQSSCMALMAAKGEITPMPDAAIFADPGWELPATYAWLDEIEKLLPFPLYRVKHNHGDGITIKTDMENARMRGIVGNGERYAAMPLYVDGGMGRAGMIRRQCTDEYKVRPIKRKVRELLGMNRTGSAPTVLATQWIGISLDEASRMRHSDVKFLRFRYPLAMELRMTRQDCLSWMDRNGYPPPSKSACVGCPFHSDREWLSIKETDPGSFEEACVFDERIRKAGGTRGDSYLHSSLVPLRTVTFHKHDPRQIDMFKNECHGMCGL